MKTSRRNWVAAAVVAGLLIAGGAGQAWATDFTWDGDTDPNNGGNWSTANNWDQNSSYPQTAADNATIPGPTIARNITVDVDAHVNKLTWPGNGFVATDTITLNADLVVDDMASSRFVHLDINGNTLFVDSAANYDKFPRCSGSGLIVKQGVGTFYMGDDWPHTFTGEWVVSNGTLKAVNYLAPWPDCPNVTVASDAGVSGTVELNCGSTADRLPLRFTIAGPGYSNQGALRFTQSFPQSAGQPTFARPITVQADATCYIGSGLTVEHTGALDGSGTLTLFGGGTFKIASTTSGHDGTIIVSNTTLSVSGLLPNVTAITLVGGAVLNGAQGHFPSATVDATGGTWNSTDTSATWSGLGDNETWSHADNWFGAVPTGIEAIIPAAGSARNIRVDTNAHVSKLTWQGGGASDYITLDADLVVSNMNATRAVNLDVNGQTLTVNANYDNSYLVPVLRGSGRIVKQSTSTFYLGFDNTQHPFSGEMVISNGIAYHGNYYGVFLTCTNVTVASSGGTNGTVQFHTSGTPHYLPQRYTIAGPGYDDLGALRWTEGNTGANAFARPITVQADATCYIGSGLTVEHTGVLDGNGVMTLIGGGTYDMNNAWTGTVSSATCNGIVAADGTVDIAGCTLSLAGLETASATEYVLVDHASANGYLVGTSFAAVNGLTGRWLIGYDGTAAHPDAVVLMLPPGTVVLFR